MNNYYSKLADVPESAKKLIDSGRLRGMTNISPMWRIKIMTETFGPCGIGWKYEIVEEKIVDIETSGEKVIFIRMAVYIKNDKNWSEPIYGYGSSKFIAKEKNGLFIDTEAFKKAQTDAFGSAVKYLGVGGNVYYEEEFEPHAEITETVPNLKYQMIGDALEHDEIIKTEQVMHLTDCIKRENKEVKAVVEYLNSLPERKKNKLNVNDKNVLKHLTYGEYETIIYLLSGFKRG